MPYQATVHKVMIASPSDVAQERRVIREVIHEWNSIHAEDRGIVLMPIGWETHSSPSMGERAQEIINAQLLRDCDLLVAAFWTRLGSPTGKAPSGTVEEIEEHIAEGKPAMIYFSSAPAHPDSVDNEQYRALREFKAECRRRGLVEEYESISEFREKFARQLAQTVIRHFVTQEPNADGTAGGIAQRPGVPVLSEAARDSCLRHLRMPMVSSYGSRPWAARKLRPMGKTWLSLAMHAQRLNGGGPSMNCRRSACLRTEPTGASSSTLPMPAIALPTFCVDNTYCLTTHCRCDPFP